MARGWESKSIEAQQDEAARDTRSSSPPLTSGQRLEREQRRALELTRARVVADLTRATAPAHREMLQRAIASLDEQLTARLGTKE